MNTRNVLVAILLGVAAGSAAAQQAGVHRGLWVGGSNLAPGSSWLLQIDPTQPATFLKTGSSGLPIGGNFWGATMDAGNQEVVLAGVTMSPIGIGFFNYDPATKAIVKTIHIGFPSPTAITNATNMTVNADGNPVTIDNQTNPQAIAEYDRLNKKWIRYNLRTTVSSSTGLAGLEWDEFNGGYWHACWGPPSALYKTTYDGRVTAEYARDPNRLAAYGGTAVGEITWVSSSWSAQAYYVVASGKWTSVATPGIVPADVTREKFAAPGEGVWVSSWLNSQGSAHHIDLKTNTVTKVFTGTSANWPNRAGEIVPLYDRDLSTVRTGKATWALHFNPGQGAQAGMPFVVAASILPGRVTLPDGREIFLGLDWLSVLSVAGPIPPFLTGNAGTLDARGRATARIDMSVIGTAANGLVLHFCGVVLDANAPSGIAWVADPHAFVVHVQP